MSDVIFPQRIHRLSQSIADQIAAGEVIERPASVVKELLENSLDAGSTDIRIDVEQGGNRLIRVTDNGCGIHQDDLLLSIDRHATSKIRTIDDLAVIQSLGFRGEALASIAAVAGFRMISRTREDDFAAELVKQPGDHHPEFRPASHPPGTTVEIRDLFSNVPARKKFLKSEKTELLHILTLVKRIALSGFNTRFRIKHNGKYLFQCIDASNNPTQRIVDVCGREFIKHTSLIEFNQNDIRLWGWLGQPEYTRSQNDLQYFYLNGRIIRDRQVNHAIRLAYQALIHPGRYPVFVLFLEMDPADVDINVHPTKHEVRFRHARAVHDFLRSSLLNVINDMTVGPEGLYRQNPTSAMNGSVKELRENYGAYQQRLNVDKVGHTPEFTYFPLVDGRYLLVEQSGQVMLIDLNLARETITALSIKNNIAEGELVTRPLLVPVMVNLSDTDMKLVNDNQQILNSLGIFMEQGGPESIRIRNIPALLEQADILSLITDLLQILAQPKQSERQDLLIKTMAKHVNDGMYQSPGQNEVKEMLHKIELLESELNPAEFSRIFRVMDKQTIMKILGD